MSTRHHDLVEVHLTVPYSVHSTVVGCFEDVCQKTIFIHVNQFCIRMIVYYCMCVNLCLSFAETGREEAKEESEFSMLSTVDMYAACFAVPSVDSAGTVEDKQNHSLSFY